MAKQWRGVIAEYIDRLDIDRSAPVITLGEGGTPLVHAPVLAKLFGVNEVWLKVEGMNPTGSFKDRGMTMAVTKAVHHGAKAVICASTGNTSASAAAYAAADPAYTANANAAYYAAYYAANAAAEAAYAALYAADATYAADYWVKRYEELTNDK